MFGDAARPLTAPLAVRAFGKERPENTLMTPQAVTASLQARGIPHLRYVCLWATDAVRHRQLHSLCTAYRLDPRAHDPRPGEALELVPGRVSAVFHHTPELLAHGAPDGRAAHLPDLTAGLSPEALVGVWAETDMDGIPAQVGEDAKWQLRRLLAERGLPNQFLDGPEQTPKVSEKIGMDHRTYMSLADLHRSLGLVDDRIGKRLSKWKLADVTAGEIAWCGIHVRRQARQRGERHAKIVVTGSVLIPPSFAAGEWTLHGWSYTDRTWRPYETAQTRFHGQDYPQGKLTELVDSFDGNSKVAATIDAALANLATYLNGQPYIAMVDAEACRRLWTGLNNINQGADPAPDTTWIPGSTLDGQQPLAIVRLNTSSEEIARPVSVTKKNGQIQKITNRLYEITPDTSEPTWLLVRVPRNFDGGGKATRLGESSTRWASLDSLDPRIKTAVTKSIWYVMNATEIYPISRDPGIRLPLAASAAQLCDQSISWLDRTALPAPLRAAAQMDLDHPQYRRTAPAETFTEEAGAASS